MLEHSIVQLLTYPDIREEVSPYLQEWMFEGDMPRAFLKVITNDKYRGIIPDIRIFSIDLHNLPSKYALGKAEILEACKLIKGAKELETDQDRENIRKSLETFIRNKKFAQSLHTVITDDKGLEDTDLSNQSYNDLVEALGFRLEEKEFPDLSSKEQLMELKELDMPEGGKIIKSYFGIINECSVYGGYKYGDLVMIAAETGAGKSTAMLCEGANAVKQGYKVAHIFLGDMSSYDGTVMYISNFLGELREKVYLEYEKYLTPEILKAFNNIKIRAFPSDTISVYDLRAKLSQLYKKFKYDMLIIDYDANFLEMNENMYKEGGGTYGQLKAEGNEKCVVIVGSQTKLEFWGNEVIPKESPAESSKKQHHVDFEFCLGKNKDCKYVGTGNLVKVRRGKSDMQTRIHFDGAHTKITEITENDYVKIKAEYKERSESKSDVTIPVSFSDDEDD